MFVHMIDGVFEYDSKNIGRDLDMRRSERNEAFMMV